MSVELRVHRDSRGGDVRFGDDGSACIGGDQRRKEKDPNHLEDVASHLYRSKLGSNLV
jgi:hypothetical protein